MSKQIEIFNGISKAEIQDQMNKWFKDNAAAVVYESNAGIAITNGMVPAGPSGMIASAGPQKVSFQTIASWYGHILYEVAQVAH